MGTHTAIDVFRPVLLSLLFCIPALSGCLEVERPCPEGTCFPLTSSAFNSILEEVGEIDALQLSEEYDRLSVSTLSRFTESGVSGEMYWKVEKDDERGIRLVSNSVVVGGVGVVGYEIWDGGPDTYTRTTDHWMKGRDMDPNYEDPFLEIARLATEDPDGRWPPFRFDVSQFSELSWTITGDAMESYQVARAKSGSDEVYFEIHGLPPRIVGITIYSEGLSQEDVSFSMSIFTGDWDHSLSIDYYLALLEGESYLGASGLSEFPRAPVPFIPVPGLQSTTGDTTSVTGTVPGEMSHEVSLSEVEMHVFSDGSSVASLMLNDGQSNISIDDGTWWDLAWTDSGIPGLLSQLDTFSVSTNSESPFDIRIYDHWAQAWTDGLE
ncbi:MAG: hypothetical protein QF736_01630 [Candidatus Thalassarchaeaceae archaeon]|nr:hypothetical protein [Candidatus Thalassarchaeaceae archaeon]